MKKVIFTFLTLAVVAAGVQTAKAGDKEWAIAGKVLTGVAAAAVITHAVTRPVYTTYSYAPAPAYPAYNYYQPAPVVYAPPPVVVYRPVYAPVPLVRYGISVGGGYHRHHSHRRVCW